MMQAGPAQRTPPSSPVEQADDDGRFEFAPPSGRRRVFVGTPVQEQAGTAGAAAEVIATEEAWLVQQTYHTICRSPRHPCTLHSAEQLMDIAHQGGTAERDIAGMRFAAHQSPGSHQLLIS